MKSTGPILIYGGNELATAIAIKLFNSQLNTVIYVNPDEILLRHNLSFGDAVYQNKKIIEDVTGAAISEDLINTNDNNSYLEKINDAIYYIMKDRQIPVIHQLSY